MATLVLNEPRSFAASEVLALAKAGRLPSLCAQVESLRAGAFERVSTDADLALYDWWGCEQGSRITGMMAVRSFRHGEYQGFFQIDHLIGTARAVRDLVLFADRYSRERGLEMLGTIAAGNEQMARFLRRLGMEPTWLVFTGPARG